MNNQANKPHNLLLKMVSVFLTTKGQIDIKPLVRLSGSLASFLQDISMYSEGSEKQKRKHTS